MPSSRRARADQRAQRINAAVALLAHGDDVAAAARQLAAQHGLSERQARRYVEQARQGGQVEVPQARVVFTVKLPADLARRVRSTAHARVSSARQKEQQTIQSQTAALLAHAAKLGLDVPAEWVFEDEGCSGATLVRPALERLRDLVCQVPVEVVLCHAPDRLARKYAYQALLVEEFARAGTEVCFVNGPTGDRPEDALLVQFQGMIAEYEKAQIIERTRRGKAHRAKQGSV